jgi:methylglyoxal synthase
MSTEKRQKMKNLTLAMIAHDSKKEDMGHHLTAHYLEEITPSHE